MSAAYIDTISYRTMSSSEYMRPQPAYAYPEQMPPYSGLVDKSSSSLFPHLTASIRPEDLSFASPVSQATRGSYYEDSFPESAHERSSPEAPSIDRGNKLLSFRASTSGHAVLDCTLRQANADLAAQLHGMFFLAESSRTGSGELVQSPPELTCYRRNLFQITGNVTLPRMMQYVSLERGERIPIVSQEVVISATGSVEASPVKIISVPWKTPVTGTAPAPEEKVEKEPTPFPLDQSGTHDIDPDYSVYPFAWKRLQFRVATANNGRRRELQQHFTIKLSVVATLNTGAKVALCEALSGPIIVRGRSPRNFQQRRDVPLSGSAASMRKSISSLTSMSPAAARRSSATGSTHHVPKLETSTDVVYTMSPTTALRRTSSPSGYEWQHPVTAPVSPYLPPTPEQGPSGTPTLKRKSSESPREMQLAVPSNGAFGLRNSAPPTDRPRKLSKPRSSIGGAAASTYIPSQPLVATTLPSSTYPFTPSLPAPTFFHHSLPKTAGAEPNELMHDYFPVGSSDEWMHPVDPLYRPHIFHPTHLPPATSVGGPSLGGRGCYGDLA